MTYLRKYRKLAVGACALLILTACVTIQPVRAALADALSVFRAEEISGIYLSPEDIAEIQEQLNNNAAEIDLKTFGKIENSGGERTQVTSLQAAEFVPFTLLQPSAQGVDIREIIAADPESMSFTLKVDNLNDALKTLGSQQLLPTNLDDKTFTLNISRRIIMNCLVDGAEINFTQTTAPELVVPEGVDADELYNSLISLPIIPDNIRRQLEGIKDWKSTFYIPVTGSDTKETDINGLKGYAGTKTDEEGRTYSAVIWSGDGVIYTLEGYAGIDDIIELARSMR